MNPLRALAILGIFALLFTAPAVLLAEEDGGAPTYEVRFHHRGGIITQWASDANGHHVNWPQVDGVQFWMEKVIYGEDGTTYLEGPVWQAQDTVTRDMDLYAVYAPYTWGAPPGPDDPSDGPDYLLWGLIALVAVLGTAVGLVWFKH